ncbi:MAG: hypothetical protein A2170_08610, partial [Deltaproteobacteria bacterium RBG_13_53_10]
GAPGMTHSMDDILQADLILIVGADVYEDNLIFSNKMREAVRRNSAKIVLVDPRRTQWEKWADLWLRPLPGSDVAWINGLTRILIEKGVGSEDFIASMTEGFETLRSSLQKFTPEFVGKAAGISPAELESLAGLYQSAKKRALVFGSGVMQQASGEEAVKALCNLGLLTGETEQSGGGIYPMLSQSNGQGACDMGALSEFLPGYGRVEEEKARVRFQEAWDRLIPEKPGFSYMEIFDKASEEGIKALYVLGEDPFITLPNLDRVRNGLRHLDFLVIQDSFITEIASYADVILPGVSFAEKDGTFTSMERRVQRVRRSIPPMGDARPDWKILCDLSSRMGYPMAYANPGEIMEEIAS